MDELEQIKTKANLTNLIQANTKALESIEELKSIDKETFTSEYIHQFGIVSRMLSEVCTLSNYSLDNFNKNHSLGKDTYEQLEGLKKGIYEELGISVYTCGDTLVVECPGVDLHRKRVDRQPYFLGCLKWALQDFKNEEEFVTWKQNYLQDEMTICFCHEYPSVIKCVDNDNLDVKNIIDTFDALGYIKTDRGDMLTHIHKGKITDRKHTTITLFPTK